MRPAQSATAEKRRAAAQRAFNRLDVAVTRHRAANPEEWRDEADEALYHAQQKIYEDVDMNGEEALVMPDRRTRQLGAARG